MTQRAYRLEFRKEDVGFVLDRIRASSSCSLVGVGSVGKSNLIAHLMNPVVLSHYLGDEVSRDVKLINADANMLAPLPEPASDALRAWSGYELLMHRLFMAFYPFELLGADEARQFYDIYQALQDGRNPLFATMGLRYFELALSYFLRKGIKIVLILDEFEEALRQLPIKFFQTLRGLRDTYKSQLCFLTFSRSPLPVLVDRFGLDPLLIEPFLELFNDSVRYIGPYNAQDALDMVANLSKRSAKPPADTIVQALLDTTGRFAGLTRAGWFALDQSPALAIGTPDELATLLCQRKSILLECETIWQSLNNSEQTVLRAVARLSPYTVNSDTEDAVAMLVQKRLLRVDRSKNSLFIEPPVFRMYLGTKV